MKQTLAKLKGEIDCSAVIVGGFNTIPAIMDRLSKQKISKKTEDLNNIRHQLDLTDRRFHSNKQEYRVFLWLIHTDVW